MATLTASILDNGIAGAKATAVVASAGGDVVINDGGVLLFVDNTGATTCNVTVTAQNTSFVKQGLGTVTVANKTLAVTAGETGLLGFFPPAVFNNASGQIAISYDQVTGVSVLAVKAQRKD